MTRINSRHRYTTRATLALLCAVLLPVGAAAQQAAAQAPTFAVSEVADSLYMLAGQGGNIGLFIGPEAAVVVDDQMAPMHAALMARIAELSPAGGAERTFVLNTHFHADHTGGNEKLGETGSIIVAHANVRERLSVEQVVPFFDMRSPALQPVGLPVVTFTSDVALHVNDEDLEVLHLSDAHTDGDAIVRFAGRNVIHAGDLVFLGTYPFIDLDNGGTIEGFIAANERLLEVCDDDTRVIPGHGPLAGKAELEAYVAMMKAVSANVRAMLAEGKSADEIVAANPTAGYDADWAGFIDGDAFTGLVVRGLSMD